MRKCKGPWLFIFVSFKRQAPPPPFAGILRKPRYAFPKRSYGGAWNGKLIWGYSTHSRVLNSAQESIRRGKMHVFGRYQYRRQINSWVKCVNRCNLVSMADWCVSLLQHHEGYINWDEYLKNQSRLERTPPMAAR